MGSKRWLKMVQLGKQGAGMKWTIPERKLSHIDILNSSAAALEFKIKAVHSSRPFLDTSKQNK